MMTGAHRPRLVFVVRSFSLGGAERQAGILADLLHRTGDFDITVVALEGGDRLHPLLAPGVSIRLLRAGAGSFCMRGLGYARFALMLRSLRPDLLLGFTDWPNKLTGAVWPLTGASAMIFNQRDEGREISGGPLERLSLRFSSCFVANSPDGIRFLTGKMGVASEKIHLIPNIVLPPPAGQEGESWRLRLGAGPDTLVLTMLASLSRFKDHGTLLDAWESFHRAFPDSRLVLAGKEIDRGQEIRQRAASLDGVEIPGEVSDTWGLLRTSDCLIHSSFKEGSPNAVYEAMIIGLPVIATDIAGTRLALGDESPWLVPPRNPDALADALIDAAGNPAKRKQTGRKNRLRAHTVFSAEAILPRWERLIRSLLRGPSPKPCCIPRQKRH